MKQKNREKKNRKWNKKTETKMKLKHQTATYFNWS